MFSTLTSSNAFTNVFRGGLKIIEIVSVAGVAGWCGWVYYIFLRCYL